MGYRNATAIIKRWPNQQREKMCDHGPWEETGVKYDAEGTGP
jgi:hypothetical protein